MGFYPFHILLRHATVMYEKYIPPGRYRSRNAHRRRTVLGEIYRRPALRIPRSQFAAPFEQFTLRRTLHKVYGKRPGTRCYGRTERRILQGIGSMGGDRTRQPVGLRTPYERLQPPCRRSAQSEKFEKTQIVHRTVRLDGEGGIAVADIAYPANPLTPHPPVGLCSGQLPLLRPFQAAHLSHAAGESDKPSPCGMAPFK